VHLLLFAALPTSAQASPLRGHGGFVNLGAAAQLEGRQGGPLRSFGVARAVEAGWLIPGGSLFLYELGIRGAVMAEDARQQHELGLFGGARLDLVHRTSSWMPFLRGGLGVAAVHLEELRFGVGPYLALGLSWELFDGVALALETTAHTRIAPFSLALGGALVVMVQAW
jgi:hypothetical protein